MDLDLKTDYFTIDVNTLNEKYQNKCRQRTYVYNIILEKCFNRINEANENNQTHLIYLIPEITFGYPLYNIAYCSAYVIFNLRRKGYQAKFYNPNIILIIWYHDIPEYFNPTKITMPKRKTIAPPRTLEIDWNKPLSETEPVWSTPLEEKTSSRIQIQVPSKKEFMRPLDWRVPPPSLEDQVPSNQLENDNGNDSIIKSITPRKEKKEKKDKRAYRSVDNIQPRRHFL